MTHSHFSGAIVIGPVTFDSCLNHILQSLPLFCTTALLIIKAYVAMMHSRIVEVFRLNLCITTTICK